MKIQFLGLIFFLLSLSGCGQKNVSHQTNSKSADLNYKAMSLAKFISSIDSAQKAIILLDSATAIDSNNYLAYFNKLMFLNKLKQYHKAIITTNNLIRLRPNAHDIYIIGGIFCEKINDTISSKNYFQKSLNICNITLDTMSIENSDYELITMNRAVNLIMLNKNAEANSVLQKLSETQTNEDMRKISLSMLNINKKDLIELYYSEKSIH